jgi:hypothetical protein
MVLQEVTIQNLKIELSHLENGYAMLFPGFSRSLVNQANTANRVKELKKQIIKLQTNR